MNNIEFKKNNNTYKLYNDNCYNLNDYKFKCDLAIIDPPYELINGGGGKCEISKRIKKRDAELKFISNGFDLSILDMIRSKQKKTNIFCFCSEKQLIKLLNYAENEKLLYNILIWHKVNPPPLINNTFLPDTEYIVYMREKGVKINTNYENARKVYISDINVNDKKKFEHPTIKPIPLINKLMQIGSNEDDTILDCFMGSGSTGISALKLKRNFLGIEIEKKYFDIAKKRIENEITTKTIFDYI